MAKTKQEKKRIEQRKNSKTCDAYKTHSKVLCRTTGLNVKLPISGQIILSLIVVLTCRDLSQIVSVQYDF